MIALYALRSPIESSLRLNLNQFYFTADSSSYWMIVCELVSVCVHKILPSGHTILPTFSFMIVLNPDDFFFLTHTQHTLSRPLFIQFTANSPHHTDFSSMLHSISLSEFSQISTNSILGGKNCISV